MKPLKCHDATLLVNGEERFSLKIISILQVLLKDLNFKSKLFSRTVIHRAQNMRLIVIIDKIGKVHRNSIYPF